MAIVTAEMASRAKKQQFLVHATGKTFPIKEELKEWGFRWLDGCWTREDASAGEVSLFRHNVSSGRWDDVNLEVIEQ